MLPARVPVRVDSEVGELALDCDPIVHRGADHAMVDDHLSGIPHEVEVIGALKALF